MARLGDIENNLELEREGRWVEYADGFEVLIAMNNHPEMVQWTMERIDEAAAAAGGLREDVSEDARKAIGLEAFARFVVKGWRGLVDDDDQPVEYTWRKALEFLRSDRMRTWSNWVIRESNRAAKYRGRLREEALGNSNGVSMAVSVEAPA